ncbi:MAG: peptidase S10 [Leptolyngbya sp. PLA3]|nr:MAG: peptidase S10 [Cyanobacteria bacterium CYA]MCE7968136.1 peptidase S10 [Leptolyngbya sp. PL-A3]
MTTPRIAAGVGETPPSPSTVYLCPRGVEKELPWGQAEGARGRKQRVRANAEWLLMREHGVPTAEVFYTSYQLEGASGGGGVSVRKRPVTFLFNGGPGAASAFLHLGTAGPKRIGFGSAGQMLPPPVQLIDNAESWLGFTDLVFVDPVGTGLSRTVAESKLEQQGVDAEEDKTSKRTKELPDAKKSFYKVKRDIDVLADFVAGWLSKYNRWDSPVSIAGESYGGFRVGKLLRALPDRGVALCGAVAVSPALDILALGGNDYDLVPWLNTVPTYALAAAYHKKSRGRFAGLKADAVRRKAEDFAERVLAPVLYRGTVVAAKERDAVFAELADLMGLPVEMVARHGGRVPIEIFSRELLRDEGLVCGLYDAAVTGPNVFPAREGMPNPDPTLAGIVSAFTAGINAWLRGGLGLSTDREYKLLGMDVNEMWADDVMKGIWPRALDTGDDIRYGLAANPAVQLFVCHGWYDMVTPFASSERSVALLHLPESLRKQVTLKHYDGGHMFYTWDKSRKALAKDVAKVVG